MLNIELNIIGHKVLLPLLKSRTFKECIKSESFNNSLIIAHSDPYIGVII